MLHYAFSTLFNSVVFLSTLRLTVKPPKSRWLSTFATPLRVLINSDSVQSINRDRMKRKLVFSLGKELPRSITKKLRNTSSCHDRFSLLLFSFISRWTLATHGRYRSPASTFSIDISVTKYRGLRLMPFVSFITPTWWLVIILCTIKVIGNLVTVNYTDKILWRPVSMHRPPPTMRILSAPRKLASGFNWLVNFPFDFASPH